MGEDDNVTRRNFIRGRINSGGASVRPPWTDNAAVIGACTRCAECIRACPEGVLVRGDGDFPVFDPLMGTGQCTFCGACMDACDAPVFDAERQPRWDAGASIDQSLCLPFRDVHCESCRDACGACAISFTPRIGGPATPLIASSACTGCGECVGLCPVQAVKIGYLDPHRRQHEQRITHIEPDCAYAPGAL